MRAFGALATLSLVGLGPTLAHAQPPAAPPPPPPREITAEASFVGVTGNSSTQTLGLGGSVTLRPNGWEHTAKVAFVRAEDEGVVDAETFNALFKTAHTVTDRLSVFGEYIYFRDQFAGVDHRNLVNGGVSYLLLNEAVHKLMVTGGLGYANEQRTPPPNLSTAVLPVGAVYTAKLSDTSTFSNDFRLTLSLSEGDERWVTNIAALTAKLTTLLSLKVSNTVRWTNQPVDGREATDTTTSVALVATF
jgi:putative salt-induced outer membrane protein YdiY